MPSTLRNLRALERRYNGPIPRSELDAVLHSAPAYRRKHRAHIRFYCHQMLQAVTASVGWRNALKKGNFTGLPSLRRLARQISLTHEIVRSADAYLHWQIRLHQANASEK